LRGAIAETETAAAFGPGTAERTGAGRPGTATALRAFQPGAADSAEQRIVVPVLAIGREAAARDSHGRSAVAAQSATSAAGFSNTVAVSTEDIAASAPPGGVAGERDADEIDSPLANPKCAPRITWRGEAATKLEENCSLE
jgi:hypothetical protein